MTRIVLLLMFLFASGFTVAQTEAVKKALPSQVQSGEPAKKVGISSAARRSSLPRTMSPAGKSERDGKNLGADGPKKHVPNGGGPTNRPDVRVPKSRPGGPITRPTGGPGARPNVPPGTRPTTPRQRPPGG